MIEAFLKKQNPTGPEKIALVLSMSVPAILAQLTSIAEQYIDAAMVGSLGAQATGAIGLVSTTTWLLGGMCIGMSSGFSVQAAQLVGAGRKDEAANVLRQGLKTLLAASFVIALVCVCISGHLPVWLGGAQEIQKNAGVYFFIFALTLPFAQTRQLCGSMMQCSGDMKTPSTLSATLCLLDVVFNFLFINVLKLGVMGAALGTACSEIVISGAMLYCACVRSPILNLRKKGSWKLQPSIMKNAAVIALPLTFDHIFMCSAYLAGTVMIAPLGTVSVAANSLSVTAESFCYMPGYGIGQASTAIIGQTIGAGRKDLTKSFSRLTVYLAMLMMALSGALMYVIAPYVFGFLTSDAQVAALGTRVLRLELIAEPLYAASICCAGVFRGAGDTLVPSIMNLAGMWGVRIVMAHFLIPVYGLAGYWIAMAADLCFRGLIFLVRLYRGSWMKEKMVEDA